MRHTSPLNREGESTRIWKEILEDIKDRGVEEVGIVVGDGLKGLKEEEIEGYGTASRGEGSGKGCLCYIEGVKREIHGEETHGI